MRVIVESPYFNKDENIIKYNQAYAFYCLKDCLLNHNEAGYASHLLYTAFLDDNIPEQRELGILAGFSWRDVAEKTVVYGDLGVSKGMVWGIEDSQAKGRPVEFRKLPTEMFNEFHEKNKHLLQNQSNVIPLFKQN